VSIGQARKEIRQIEHENDQIVHSIYQRLNRSFVTPIDSNDILALSSGYDTIIDYIYATINRFYLYKIVSPDRSMKSFAEIVDKCAVEVVKISANIQKLKTEIASASAEEIDRLENEADELLDESLAALFEQRPDPLEVMKLKEVYELMEQITDRFEDVALFLRDFSVRYA
jgi:predicted phosphate transport protein (TIGR00153 family)